MAASKKTQTPAKTIRQLTKLCGTLIFERDAMARELARLKRQPEPLPFMEQLERLREIKTQRRATR